MVYLPLEPSMSFFLAGAEKGSALNISEAWRSSRDASSTRLRAGGISCLRIWSSLLLIVSYPTCIIKQIKVNNQGTHQSNANIHQNKLQVYFISSTIPKKVNHNLKLTILNSFLNISRKETQLWIYHLQPRKGPNP